MCLPDGASGKEPTHQGSRHRRGGFNPWVGNILWRRKRQLTPKFLPGKSHGQRSLVAYSPWGCKELDTTKDFQERDKELIGDPAQNVLHDCAL